MARNVHIRALLKPSLKNCRRVSSVSLSQPSRLHRTSRTMSSESHSIGTKNPKFGHLPLSTSGPEECALTVLAMIPSLCDTIVSIWLTLGRVWPSFDLHITTRALLSLRMSAKNSSFTVYYLQMCRRSKSKSSGRISSTVVAQMR